MTSPDTGRPELLSLSTTSPDNGRPEFLKLYTLVDPTISPVSFRENIPICDPSSFHAYITVSNPL